jgi:hypothetical protein
VSTACDNHRQQYLPRVPPVYGFLEADAHARLEKPDPAREIEWANGLPRPALYRQYSEADSFGFSP